MTTDARFFANRTHRSGFMAGPRIDDTMRRVATGVDTRTRSRTRASMALLGTIPQPTSCDRFHRRQRKRHAGRVHFDRPVLTQVAAHDR
jgi:hypothetical protein